MEMSFAESLLVDGFGFSIVFAVLIALSLVVKLISVVVPLAKKKREAEIAPEAQAAEITAAEGPQFSDGELKLFDVDEKTAALIMAIVSDESGIPLSQLRFSSIRLIK
jgi:Na+-transporting methylmalonyl-CoA/oxaloacetate decarboxylase gamma subunit